MTAQIGQLAAQPGSAELKQAVLSSLDNLQTQLNAPFCQRWRQDLHRQNGREQRDGGNMGSALG